MVTEMRSRLSLANSSTSLAACGRKQSHGSELPVRPLLPPMSRHSFQVSCRRCSARRFSISTRPPAGAVLAIRSRAASISCQVESKVTSVCRPWSWLRISTRAAGTRSAARKSRRSWISRLRPAGFRFSWSK